jgi:hypothetical protein
VKRLLPFLAILAVALLLAAPRERPNPAPSGTSGVAGSASLGAPLASATSQAETTTEALTTLVPSGAPHPTAVIDETGAFAWAPGHEPTPTPRLRLISHGGIVGDATYYCRPGISRCTRGYPFGMYAAAGPELRAMLGDWRGQFVIVTDAVGRGVVVQLIDFCACGGSHVIDLYWTAYQGMVNPVTVKEEP